MFYFTNRVVDAWNSLPNWIVTANSTNTVKCRLNTYWQDQEIIYDFMHRYREPEDIVKYLDTTKYWLC